VIKPLALSARNTLWPNSTGVRTLQRDQGGQGFEDRIDFLGIGDLLAIEHAAARLIDHTLDKTTIVCNLVAKGVNRHGGKEALAARLAGSIERGSGARYHFLGNADQFTVGRGLPRSGGSGVAA
jgi:hypothetical protein